MQNAQTRITSQGQVSVPVQVRQQLGLVPGSTLEWFSEGDRVFVSRAVRHSTLDAHNALFGDEAAPAVPPKSARELKDGIRALMRRRHARD